jgi:hypothetical protein
MTYNNPSTFIRALYNNETGTLNTSNLVVKVRKIKAPKNQFELIADYYFLKGSAWLKFSTFVSNVFADVVSDIQYELKCFS